MLHRLRKLTLGMMVGWTLCALNAAGCTADSGQFCQMLGLPCGQDSTDETLVPQAETQYALKTVAIS